MTAKPLRPIAWRAVDCSCTDGEVPDENSSDPDDTLECGLCYGDGWRWEFAGILIDRGEHVMPDAATGGWVAETRYAIGEQS